MGEIFSEQFIQEQNEARFMSLESDYAALGASLDRRGVDIETITKKARAFSIALPSWGVGTGGTRFARFPGQSEPRNFFEKLEDCAVINNLCRITPEVSPHFPWDAVQDMTEAREFAQTRGLSFTAVNSNTFQNQVGQGASYKFGSLTHTDSAVRRFAIDHNIQCIEWGKQLGSKILTVWIGDGSNFPGQQHFSRSLDRYLSSMREIYDALPADWRVFIEHKMYEPSFYSTVIQDWGTSILCAKALGDKAFSLVDLGHHAPNVNIEMIVSRLIQFKKLAGFHFNDSKYGDDDLDSGAINPYQQFLIFNELVDGDLSASFVNKPEYMLDQSHNVTDPIESLITSAASVQRSYVQALIIDRQALESYQDDNDALMASETLKVAFQTDVTPILQMARKRSGGAIDPVSCYRAGHYRETLAQKRPAQAGASSGIV